MKFNINMVLNITNWIHYEMWKCNSGILIFYNTGEIQDVTYIDKQPYSVVVVLKVPTLQWIATGLNNL